MEKIWLKSYGGGVPQEMEFEKISLAEALSRTAKRFPNNPALLFQGTSVRYSELEDMVSRFASGLVKLGVKPGDKVSLLLPNLVQTVVATYGALRAGAVVVLNNPLYTDRELEHQYNDSGSKFLVCLDVLLPRMINLRPKTKIGKIVSCHIRDYLPFIKKLLFPIVRKGMHLNTPSAPDLVEFMDLVKRYDPIAKPPIPNWDDTAVLIYTGGTTGVSKGVELTHGNLSSNVQQCLAWFPGFEAGKEIAIGCLPFFHSFGLTTAMNMSIFSGWADVLIPKPEPKTILESISSYKATYMPAVPTLYNGMINFPELKNYDITSLKGCFSGGAPLPLETIRSFEKLTGAQICEGYGLTETSPVTHINPFGAVTKPGTIGLPISNTNAKLVEIDDYTKEITEPSQPGELCLKGPQIMKGYINRPEETEATLKDGWLLTGDIAIVDEQGYFSIVDRKKDMIISGGFNVYPRDVDEVLFTHPKVLEACVIGVPDEYSGERIKAYVVLKPGEETTPDEIIDFCKKNLVKYKVPKYVEFVEDLPKSAVGKILRKELRRIDQAKAGKPSGK
ncbi:MAG: long-chain fatty acid--CoA ligase [Desulfomonile tiedjei]|uniref:Long-chain fatty acid--CoA ligase n=1 Tax=Desulfomonile tiedjei TaxID=2358 RepID=A0A9D6V3H2_9BACT|nr:long-chain fatty acid--CoA ligase [Desulfomonile tiedjei]